MLKRVSITVLLVILETGIASPKVFSLDFYRTRTSTLQKRQQPVAANLANLLDYGGYFVDVSVGTPPRNISLLIDTGSSDTWVFGPGVCTSEYCLDGSYDFHTSTTSSTPPNYPKFAIEYEDGSNATGFYVQDNLMIGTATVTSMVIAQATYAPDIFAGIMGIGLDTNEAEATTSALYSNFPDVLVQQGLTNTRAYSIWLNGQEDASGVILFGGYDRAKFTGSLTPIALLKTRRGAYREFAVTLASISVTTSDDTRTINSKDLPVAAILDTGSFLSYFPNDIYNYIKSTIDAYTDDTLGDDNYLALCSQGDSGRTLDLQFTGSGGPIIRVQYSQLLIPLTYDDGSTVLNDNGQAICLVGIANNEEYATLGDTILRSIYVVLDLDNKIVFVGSTVLEATGSDIVEIQKGIAPSGNGGAALSVSSMASTIPVPATVTISSNGPPITLESASEVSSASITSPTVVSITQTPSITSLGSATQPVSQTTTSVMLSESIRRKPETNTQTMLFLFVVWSITLQFYWD